MTSSENTSARVKRSSRYGFSGARERFALSLCSLLGVVPIADYHSALADRNARIRELEAAALQTAARNHELSEQLRRERGRYNEMVSDFGGKLIAQRQAIRKLKKQMEETRHRNKRAGGKRPSK